MSEEITRRIIARTSGTRTRARDPVNTGDFVVDGTYRYLRFELAPLVTDWDAVRDGRFLDLVIERSDDDGQTWVPDKTLRFQVGSRDGRSGGLAHFADIPLWRIALPLDEQGNNLRHPDGSVVQQIVWPTCRYRGQVRLPRDMEIGVTARMIPR